MIPPSAPTHDPLARLSRLLRTRVLNEAAVTLGPILLLILTPLAFSRYPRHHRGSGGGDDCRWYAEPRSLVGLRSFSRLVDCCSIAGRHRHGDRGCRAERNVGHVGGRGVCWQQGLPPACTTRIRAHSQMSTPTYNPYHQPVHAHLHIQEWIARATAAVGRRYRSLPLKVNAAHHRSDALR